MGVLNRTPVVVRARQPFVDWINGLPGNKKVVTLEEVHEEKDVFLMYDSEIDENKEIHFLDIMDFMFEFELNEWTIDPSEWPRDRSEKVFREWFDVEIMSLAIDPYDEIIEDEDWDDGGEGDELWEDGEDDGGR